MGNKQKPRLDWISMRECCRILGITAPTFVRRYASMITQQRLPLIDARYSRSEVEAMAQAAIVKPKEQLQ